MAYHRRQRYDEARNVLVNDTLRIEYSVSAEGVPNLIPSMATLLPAKKD